MDFFTREFMLYMLLYIRLREDCNSAAAGCLFIYGYECLTDRRLYKAYHCCLSLSRAIISTCKSIGSNFPERIDILLCIVNHFRMICSNQMNKKRCFQELYFWARNHDLNECHKTKANRFLR